MTLRVLIAITITLVILETGSYLFDPPVTTIVEFLEDGTMILDRLPDAGLYIRTSKGTRLRKNVRAILRNHVFGVPEVEIITNSLGFRHKELDKKEPNLCRILVLGDSITFGDCMPNKLTYPSQIEFCLNTNNQKNRTEDVFEVINAGIGSIDLENEFEILKESCLAVDPDIVIVGLYLNDAFGSPAFKMLHPPPILDKSHFIKVLWDKTNKVRVVHQLNKWLTSQEKIIRHEKEKFAQLNQITGVGRPGSQIWLNQEIYKNFSDWGYAWSEGYWNRVLPILELMQKSAEQNDFQLLVVFFPVAQQVYSNYDNSEPQKRFCIEMEKRKILYLDILPLLREKVRKDHVQIFFDHCHYNRGGNAFIGKTISISIIRHFFKDDNYNGL